MPLWNREEDKLPVELKGLTPEQIVEKLKAIEIETAKSKDLEAKLAEKEASLTSLTTERDQFRQKAEELEAKVPPDKTVDSEPPSIWTDPGKFVQDQTQQTRNMALLSGMMSAKLYARNGLSSTDAKIFTKYEKEIDQIVSSYVSEARVMPQTWMNALVYVKGLHMDDISKAQSAGGEFFSETPSSGPTPEPNPVDKLTPDEEAVCKSMHWDPKMYLEQKKKERVVGSHVQYGN